MQKNIFAIDVDDVIGALKTGVRSPFYPTKFCLWIAGLEITSQIRSDKSLNVTCVSTDRAVVETGTKNSLVAEGRDAVMINIRCDNGVVKSRLTHVLYDTSLAQYSICELDQIELNHHFEKDLCTVSNGEGIKIEEELCGSSYILDCFSLLKDSELISACAANLQIRNE